MKKTALVYGITFFFSTMGFAQALNCPIANSISFSEDYETMPTAIVKVNFHFLPIDSVKANPNNPSAAHDYTQQEAETLAGQLIGYVNQNFENLQHANSPPFYLSSTLPHVPKAKMNLALYDGGQGSVFLYSGPNKTHLNTRSIQTRYGQGNVLDIIISYDTNCTMNYADRENSFIVLCNFNQIILTNSATQQNRAQLLAHEVAHIFGLEHTFQCGQCNSEINHTVECGGNCSCNRPSNPGNNLLSDSGANNEMTPCQWSIMFNNIISTSNIKLVNWDCQKKTTPLIVNGGNVYWTDLKIIDRDVIVQSGTLTINCEVRFVNDCKIIVNSSANLKIDDGKLTNLCTGQWAGIESQGDLRITDSKIEHAVTAVSRQGGYFRASNTIFENNMRDIEYLDKPASPIIDIHNNCTFRIKDSYRGSVVRSRVTMWNSKAVFFNGCDFINEHTNPYQFGWYFPYDWQGIYAVGSSFQTNKFNSKRCTFTNFSVGIRVATIGTAEAVNILNSDFNQNDIGVISEAFPNINIRDNKFNVRWDNAFPRYSWYRAGLYINSGSEFTVNNNEFTGYGNGAGQYTLGALISETGEDENDIESNKYSNLYVGNRVLFKNKNNSSNDPMGLELLCNNHNGNVYDHSIETFGNPSGGFRLKQGNESNPDGNQFSNNGGAPDIWMDMPDGFERFYQNPLILERSLALPYIPNTPHPFIQTISPNQATCIPFQMIMGAQQSTELLSMLSDTTYATELSAESIAALSQEFEATDTALKTAKTQHNNLIDGGNRGDLLSNIRSRWHRDTAALRTNLLLQSPNLSTTVLLAIVQLGILKKQALMQIFFANPSACREPQFLRNLQRDFPNLLTDNEIQQLRTIPTGRSRRSQLEQTINAKSSQRASIAKIVLNHYLTQPEMYKPQLRYWWERLGSRHALYSLAESYIKESQSNRYETLMRNLNNDLAYSDDYVRENQDYIELYGIKSKILKSGRSLRQLNPSEIKSLRRIAQNTRADAAVQANNILCIAVGECKQFEIPRFSANQGTGQGIIMNNGTEFSKIKENSFNVYPNPTSSSLTVDFDIQKEFTEGYINLIDLTGKTILTQKINNKQQRVIWQTGQLKAGLYFVILKVDNEIVYQNKVSVQK